MKLKGLTKTVASTGTPEPLSVLPRSSTFIKIRALTSNTDTVYIGDSAGQDFPLEAGEELPLSIIPTPSGGADALNLRDIYCKVDVNGEGVAILIVERE